LVKKVLAIAIPIPFEKTIAILNTNTSGNTFFQSSHPVSINVNSKRVIIALDDWNYYMYTVRCNI